MAWSTTGAAITAIARLIDPSVNILSGFALSSGVIVVGSDMSLRNPYEMYCQAALPPGPGGRELVFLHTVLVSPL